MDAVDLPGVLPATPPVRFRVPLALAFQRLPELALHVVLGTLRFRRGGSHADLLPLAGYDYSLAHLAPPVHLPPEAASQQRKRRPSQPEFPAWSSQSAQRPSSFRSSLPYLAASLWRAATALA